MFLCCPQFFVTLLFYFRETSLTGNNLRGHPLSANVKCSEKITSQTVHVRIKGLKMLVFRETWEYVRNGS